MTIEQNKPLTATVLRYRAESAYRKGDTRLAINNLQSLLKDYPKEATVNDKKLLAMYLFFEMSFPEAKSVMSALLVERPDDFALRVNLGVCFLRLKQPSKALAHFEVALKAVTENTRRSELLNLYDALSNTYSRLGLTAKSVEFGRKSLQVKDAAVSLKLLPGHGDIPAFSPSEPHKNIISFSLWGKDDKYCLGAIENARIAPVLFPEWRCRFYCDDSVPRAVIETLLSHGADVICMGSQAYRYEGLFWRFQVANDPTVSRFLVRDADSVLSVRERAAVIDWIQDGRPFHMMRDYYTHTDLMLAGMWGGIAGLLPALKPLQRKFVAKGIQNNTVDQKFLNAEVWGYVKSYILIHDDIFGCFDAKPFPPHAYCRQGHHVGQALLPSEYIRKGQLTTRLSLLKGK